MVITSMASPLQHLRSVRAEDLAPNQEACNVCATPWGIPKDANGSLEYPIILTCGCIAGSSCLERSFRKSPRCPLCRTTIRVIAGLNAPLKHSTSAHLRQLELRSGVNDWPIPSIESRHEMSDRASMGRAEQAKHDLQGKLDVLNGCHGTFLSMRELEICISLVGYRLGTTTSAVDVLDAFIDCPLFRLDLSADLAGKTTDALQSEPGFDDAASGDLRDVLMLVNMRAGTSFLLDELELVMSLMNFIHGSGVGLLDVLGLRDGALCGRSVLPGLRLVDEELVGAFGTLDIRVGSRNAVEDLGDVFSQATL